MDSSALINIVKNRWLKVSLILLIVSILFAAIYGRQTFATYLIYSNDEKQKSYLHITPKFRNLTPTHVKNGMVFNAFGYNISVPLNKSPQFLDLDKSKGIFFLHEYDLATK